MDDDPGVFSADLDSIDSIPLSDRGGISGLLCLSVLTTVWEGDIAEVKCGGRVGLRVGDDFRNLQTNRTFLNTIQSGEIIVALYIYR